MIYWLIAKVALCVLAGLANAAQDTIHHHHSISVWKKHQLGFFAASGVSWRNIYKLGEPRYGRKKWFNLIVIPAFLMDMWHLGKWLMLAFLFFGVAMPSGFIHWVIEAGTCWGAFWIGFQVGYKGLWLRK